MSEQVFFEGDTLRGNPIQQGVCPCCGKISLDYDVLEPLDEQVFYPWTCLDCGSEGSEYYNLVFSGHNVKTEVRNDIEMGLLHLLAKIGMDKPENYDEMLEFVRNDVEETADAEFSEGDIVIAFRRFIEKK